VNVHVGQVKQRLDGYALLKLTGIEIMKSALLFSIALTALLFQLVANADRSTHSGSWKGPLEVGQPLPVLDIQAGGEISVSNNKIVKKPWSSMSFENKGQVQIVQYIAANRGVYRQNKPFTDALDKKQLSSEQLNTTVILHMADTMPFAKNIVVKKVAEKKVNSQEINFVIDDIGVGMQRWGVKHYSFAIIVLDRSGKVLFSKDGPMTEAEVESTIKLIEKQTS
jgi:YtfJ family uncharacterized protein